MIDERSRASNRKWYYAHRDEYNAERRRKYAKNPDIRAKARSYSRAWQARMREGSGIERKMFRTINGNVVRVYTSGEVAQKIGSSSQMLRNWERRGWIPASTFADSIRLYLPHQVKLLSQLSTRLKKPGTTRVARAAIIAAWNEEITGQW